MKKQGRQEVTKLRRPEGPVRVWLASEVTEARKGFKVCGPGRWVQSGAGRVGGEIRSWIFFCKDCSNLWAESKLRSC